MTPYFGRGKREPVAQKPETVLRQNLVRPFLQTLKNTFFEPIQQATIRGSPDFVLCIHGRFCSLELKDVGEEPRPLQELKLFKVTRTGGLRIVADRDNWKQVKELLSKMDQSKEYAWKVQSKDLSPS